MECMNSVIFVGSTMQGWLTICIHQCKGCVILSKHCIPLLLKRKHNIYNSRRLLVASCGKVIQNSLISTSSTLVSHYYGVTRISIPGDCFSVQNRGTWGWRRLGGPWALVPCWLRTLGLPWDSSDAPLEWGKLAALGGRRCGRTAGSARPASDSAASSDSAAAWSANQTGREGKQATMAQTSTFGDGGRN